MPPETAPNPTTTTPTSLTDPKNPPQPSPSTTPDPTTGDKLFNADGTPKVSETPPVVEGEKNPDGTPKKSVEEKKPDDVALTLDKLKLPEGFDAKNPLAEEFLGTVNDAALSATDRANKLLELYAKGAAELETAQQKLWLETNQKWQGELVTEFGEEKLEANLHKVGSLLEAFEKDRKESFVTANAGKPAPEFGKELREAMTLTGAGNNPAIVKFLFWAAEQLGEGAPLSGTPAGGTQSRAEKLFGS